MELWHPDATRDRLDDAGGFLAGPYRGVLHTTEGASYAGARAAYVQHRSAPHFTVGVEGLWQHIALDRAARSLENLPGGVQTNLWSAIQVEVVQYAGKPWPDALVPVLRDLMMWIEAQTGIQPSAPPFHGPNEGIVLAITGSPIRMAPAAWRAFNGWCGHQHVPENRHWDPGGLIPIAALLDRGTSAPPVPVPAPAPPDDWTEEALMALPTLARGAKGQHVKILQGLLLVAAGDLIDEANIDGDFGPRTETVLRTWQGRTKSLAADGVCGPATWRWLIGA